MANQTDHLLAIFVKVFVPLRILELQEQGVTEEDFARARSYLDDFGSQGDQLLYRGKRSGELAGNLVDAIAVLAFCPGGVTVFDVHFEGGNYAQDDG